MKLTLSAEDQAFREEVREFMRTSFPEDIKARFERSIHLPKDDFVRWQKILYNKGWVAPAWPKEYGGTGWDPIKRYIFDQEMNAAGAPAPIAFAFSMVGPVLYTFANQAQKDHFLPRILSSEDFWCQGFSEPGSGSDLASLKTRAVREGDEYVVNGARPVCRLDLLPGAHRQHRQEAGRHLVPADRHEDPGHLGDADHHHRWRPRGQSGVLRGRAGAGREPGGRGRQGLDLCQIPAQP